MTAIPYKLNETYNKIRIIVPAYNSMKTIKRCISSIIEATVLLESSEIIIVDNGKNKNLDLEFENYPVRVLKRNEISGAAYARNEGAKGFSDGILVFIDSDIVCEKMSIRKLVEPILNGLCDATIGNYSRNWEGLSFAQKYKQCYINYINSRGGNLIKNDYWTAISSVKADVFNKLNGFNVSYKSAMGEDQEFGIRLTKNSYKTWCVKDSMGQHFHPYTVIGIIKSDFKRGINTLHNYAENRAPLTHSRHAGKRDILSVISSVMFLCLAILGIFFSPSLYASLIFFILWISFRMKLIIGLCRITEILFGLKAIVLAFLLDVVRFSCVAICFSRVLLLGMNFPKDIENHEQ